MNLKKTHTPDLYLRIITYRDAFNFNLLNTLLFKLLHLAQWVMVVVRWKVDVISAVII